MLDQVSDFYTIRTNNDKGKDYWLKRALLLLNGSGLKNEQKQKNIYHLHQQNHQAPCKIEKEIPSQAWVAEKLEKKEKHTIELVNGGQRKSCQMN